MEKIKLLFLAVTTIIAVNSAHAMRGGGGDDTDRSVCDVFIKDPQANAASCKHEDCVIQEVDLRRVDGNWLYQHQWTEVTPLDANSDLVESETVRRSGNQPLPADTSLEQAAKQRYEDALGNVSESADISDLFNLRPTARRRGKSFNDFGGCRIDGCRCVRKEYKLPNGSVWPAPEQVFDVSGKRYRELGAAGDYSEAAEMILETVKTGASGRRYLVTYAVKLYGILKRIPGACRRPAEPM